MQSVTKNGITISFPDDIEPNKSYEITYSVTPSHLLYSKTTEFWIITQGGKKQKITFTQAGVTPAS